MTIWKFQTKRVYESDWSWGIENTCRFCNIDLKIFTDSDWKEDDAINVAGRITKYNLGICNNCGWWNCFRSSENYWHSDLAGPKKKFCGNPISIQTNLIIPKLIELNYADLSTPLDEIKNYLKVQFNIRFILHPRIFEETVASVFKDLGYKTIVTSYSNDGGIDIFLHNGNIKIGVQVKRYKNRIELDQINALTGALVAQGLTKGIFVTTSEFRSGCSNLTARLKGRGIKIDLINASKLFEALNITPSNKIDSFEEFEIINRIKNIKVIGGIVYNPT